MTRWILCACALLILGPGNASPAEPVSAGGPPLQQGLPVPQKMLGVWMLADTGQCANPMEKLIITPATIQFGTGKPERLEFIPHSGAFGGDALRWSDRDQALEYDSQNDRMIWEAKSANAFTAEYYERCPW